ncbi:hypothetical protein OUZ56_025265 [Daphnia magna]|uniref:Uncharacterized protein n=1 Tax=Daphnia magna TaxID=35525 RepID=A0ABQ9ZJC2_9CRUS|nr:hypothetical protein OUZ56_025265 [Daphnia magna]
MSQRNSKTGHRRRSNAFDFYKGIIEETPNQRNAQFVYSIYSKAVKVFHARPAIHHGCDMAMRAGERDRQLLACLYWFVHLHIDNEHYSTPFDFAMTITHPDATSPASLARKEMSLGMAYVSLIDRHAHLRMTANIGTG